MKKACVEVFLDENIDFSNEDVTKKNINGRIANKTFVQQFQSENGQEAQTQNALKKVRSLFFESYFVF